MKLTLDKYLHTILNKTPTILRHLGNGALAVFDRLAIWLATNKHGERITLLTLAAVSPFLVFYNLEINPRPWIDEGATLQLARTLAEDGIYAVRNSDGYQTFGPVQSVGPTVIVPVALVFRIFGVGLLQGRIVGAIYTLVALLLFFLMGQHLFGRLTAILSLLFMLAAPAVSILRNGRSMTGEVAALAFFLASWLVLSHALRNPRLWWTILAGILFGATILTKIQYMIMVITTLGLVGFLDLVYYRQQIWKTLGLVILLALGFSFTWQAWQMSYYGFATYQADLAMLRKLALVTSGFQLSNIIGALRLIMGNEGGNFYLFWGFPALGYIFVLANRRNLCGILLSFLAFFTSLWLLYCIVGTQPTTSDFLPAMVLLALFIAKLYSDLLEAAWPTVREFLHTLSHSITPTDNHILALGTLVGLFCFALWIGFCIQKYVRADVLDRIGNSPVSIFSLPNLQYPRLAADYLEKNVEKKAVIETWERELSILTDLNYHSPDQSMLVDALPASHGSGKSDYLLGEDYFTKAKVDYVVIGWFARLCPVYNMDYLRHNSKLVAAIGEGNFNYEIYHLKR